ncbi:MAG: TspO/MBR family protein [Bacillota bacterium]
MIIIKKFFKLITSLFICQGAGLVGSLLTTPKIETWYSSLNKPFFNPPAWVFSPVWIVLYFLIGISLYLIWIKQEKSYRTKAAWQVFVIQLLLNIAWSAAFFTFESPLAGLLVILLLWVVILGMIYIFYQVSRWSSYLLIPYFLWVSFAVVLNWSILILN